MKTRHTCWKSAVAKDRVAIGGCLEQHVTYPHTIIWDCSIQQNSIRMEQALSKACQILQRECQRICASPYLNGLLGDTVCDSNAVCVE